VLTGMTLFYLGLIAICGGYIALSFVIGTVADTVDDVSDGVSGLLESLSHALESITGAGHAADADLDPGAFDPPDGAGDHDASVDHGPSPFSLRTISMFGVGFGAGGLLGKGLGMPDMLSLLPAGGAGTVAGALMWLFLRLIYGSVGSTSVTPADYAGLIGRVSVAIPGKTAGGVTVVVKGQRKTIPAVSADGGPVPAGAEVAVVAMNTGVAVVEPLQGTERGAAAGRVEGVRR